MEAVLRENIELLILREIKMEYQQRLLVLNMIRTEAQILAGTILISPGGSLSVAYLPSFAINCAPLPAERTS